MVARRCAGDGRCRDVRCTMAAMTALLLAFLEGPELIIILVIILVLFGGSQLPRLARSLGEAKKEFEKGMTHDEKSAAADSKSDASAPDEKKSGSASD